MALIGCAMMCEQAGPKQRVRDVGLAEEAGFDFAVMSDRYSPWLEAPRATCAGKPQPVFTAARHPQEY